MRRLNVCAAAMVVAGLAATPAMAREWSPGPADGFYNDMGSIHPSLPNNIESQPTSRTRAFAPEPRATLTPVVPMWQEREHRYDRSATPNLGYHSGMGPWGPSSQ